MIEVRTDDARATMAVTLTMEAKLSDVACRGAVCVHYLFIANIVRDKVETAPDDLDCL